MEPIHQINTKKIGKEVAQHIVKQMKQDIKDTRHKITYGNETSNIIKSVI